MYRLSGAVKPYAWGSSSVIQEFAGVGDAGSPLAEVWFGAHPSGPTTIPSGETLAQALADRPAALGELPAHFDGLPFLLKFLAPGQAVSIQVHPHRDRARRAFDAGDPRFVDPRHKPEMIYALTAFEGLLGVRPREAAVTLLRRSRHPLLREAAASVSEADGLAPAFRLLAAAPAEAVQAVLDEIASSESLRSDDAYQTATELAVHYPGDAGVLVSLLLDRRRLEPGDAVFVPSGVPHAYLSGLAIEIMANSDNVFRLGLTGKRVDVDETLANLITDEPVVIPGAHVRRRLVLPDADEFALAVYRQSEPFEVEEPGPKIAVVVEGEACFRASGAADADGGLVLRAGEAVFLGADERVTVDGAPHLVVGFVPSAAQGGGIR